MCGIVGYIGTRAASGILIEGLKTLRVSRLRFGRCSDNLGRDAAADAGEGQAGQFANEARRIGRSGSGWALDIRAGQRTVSQKSTTRIPIRMKMSG